MFEREMRARVERLLHGPFRNDDLLEVLLFVRERSDGRQTVREVGDFIAHRERNRGPLIFTTAQHMYYGARIHTYAAEASKKGDWSVEKLPAEVKPHFKTLSQKISKQTLRELRLSLSQVRELCSELSEALVSNSDGTLRFSRYLTALEYKVLSRLMGQLNSFPAFSGIRLGHEFVETLKSNRLISKSEARDYGFRLSLAVQLLALCKLNSSRIRIDDRTVTTLSFGLGGSQKEHLGIFIFVPSYSSPNVSLSCSLFDVNARPEEFCEPDVLEACRLFGHTPPMIDLTPDLRLCLIKSDVARKISSGLATD